MQGWMMLADLKLPRWDHHHGSPVNRFAGQGTHLRPRLDFGKSCRKRAMASRFGDQLGTVNNLKVAGCKSRHLI